MEPVRLKDCNITGDACNTKGNINDAYYLRNVANQEASQLQEALYNDAINQAFLVQVAANQSFQLQKARNQELQREQEALRAAAAASVVVWYMQTHPLWAASVNEMPDIPFWQIATAALFLKDPYDWRVIPYVTVTTKYSKSDKTTVRTLSFPSF